jgi:hypothetical protein
MKRYSYSLHRLLSPWVFTSRSISRQYGTSFTHNHATTVIRARGYQPLRPEKSWRPIVSVVVDEHSHYEVNLGCDGQNPNLKERFVMSVTLCM